MQVVNPHDWKALGAKFRVAEPFPSICIDNFLVPAFADELAEAHPDYDSARHQGREFDTLNEQKKVQVTDPASFPAPYRRLCLGLSSKAFLAGMSELSGIGGLTWDANFTGGGLHATARAGLLDVHVDFNFESSLGLYRRLNILIYLNPAWEPAWGGAVEFWDAEVKECSSAFLPIHNRCIIFATSDRSFHGVAAVSCPPGVVRKSFAAYYYSAEPGDNAGEIYGGHHSTIFRARPHERYKKYWAMPLERARLRVLEAGRRLVHGPDREELPAESAPTQKPL